MDLLPLIHTLATSVPEALIILDPKGRILESNQRANLLLGPLAAGTAVHALLPDLNPSREGITRLVVNGMPLLCTTNHQGQYTIISFSVPDTDGIAYSISGKRMQDLHNVTLELAGLHSLAELYHQAVAKGMACLGVSSLAILLYDPDLNEICGTWGTGPDGQVTDQSSYRSPLAAEGNELFDRLKDSRLISVWGPDSPVWHDQDSQSSWSNLATLWDGDRLAGWIAAGNAPPDTALDETQRELLLVYARSLSSFMTGKRHEEELEAAVALKTLEVQKNELHFRELSADLLHQKEEIEQLFTIMAHDLRGPLGVLRNIIVTAAENSRFLAPEDVLELLPDMSESVEATYSLLDNLLNWVRSKMKEITVLEEWHSIGTIFDSIHQWLDRLAFNKGITILTHADPALMVHADQRMIETILRNLVSNAIKFSPPGSTVELGAARSADGSHMVLTVRDHGQGMSQEQIGRLFSMKDHRIQTGTAGEKGSGLGLMFSQDLARRLGGCITVESQPGRGSTFTLDIPDKVEEELPPV